MEIRYIFFKQLEHDPVDYRRLLLKFGIKRVEGRGVVAEVFGVAHEVEMAVNLLADVVGDVFDEQCCKVLRFVDGAAHAERPLQVAERLKPRSLGQQRAVGDARTQGVVLSAEETFYRLDQPCLALQPYGAQEVGTQHPVDRLDAEVDLRGQMAESVEAPLHVCRGGVGRVELRERRGDEQNAFHRWLYLRLQNYEKKQKSRKMSRK